MPQANRTKSNPVPWKRVAVFVSSTFSDMHAERDYLVKRVFPDLQDWCERRRLRLVDVDLRWGGTEEDATQNRNVVQTCLKRIDECRPFFLCFVGQRRGWVPMPEEIHPRTLEAFPELRQHIGKASVTELEILHAILRPLHGDTPHDPARDPDYYRPADYSFFYLRDPSYLDSLPADPPELLAAYTNSGGDNPDRHAHDDAELRRWREVEIPKCGRPVHEYSAQWDPDLSTPELALPMVCPASAERGRDCWRERWIRAGMGLAPDGVRVADENQALDFNRRLTAGRLAEFRHEGRELADVILDDLKRGIAARYPEHVEAESKPGSLQTELDQQEQFLFVNSEGFIERGHDFDELDEYVRGDSRKLFVLTAEGGMGKSMLLANWIDRCRAEGSPLAKTPFLFRFIGQSDGSTTAASVQASILTELREVHGRLPETVRVKDKKEGGAGGAASESVEREVPLEIPGDPNKLLEFWRELLPKAAAHGKCVIVIDALNQLEEGLEHLHWLPQGQLPEGLKFIVSFRRGAPGSERLLETWRGPYYADKVQLAEVWPFAEKQHRRALVDAYLDQYLKALDDNLIEELISVEGAANPLFLKIVLSELRVFGSFEQLGQKIRTDFGTDPVSAFRAVLRRIISDPAYSPLPSAQVVPLVFGTLACARGGLSVIELSDILCRALGQTVPTEDQLQKSREAVLVILRQERPFLARRDGRYDFFYESFQTAARDAFYLAGKTDDMEVVPPENREKPKESHTEEPAPSGPQEPESSARPGRDWHSLIADHYVAQTNSNRRRLSELPHHLTSAERWDDLIGNDETPAPLSDLLFIQAKCEAGLVYELVSDYNAALAALPEFREENERNRRHDVAMIAYNKALREYAGVRCDWWFAKERGEPRPEPSYPKLPPELKAESLTTIPEESSSRAARLRHFSNFVSSHIALLKYHPNETPVFAYNWAKAGPVTKESEQIISKIRTPYLCRTSKPFIPPIRPSCHLHMHGHSGRIDSVGISIDGQYALSMSSDDKSIRLWDTGTGQCHRILQGGHTIINHYHGMDGLRDRALYGGKLSYELNTTIKGVHFIDGKHALTGTILWDLTTGECLFKLPEHRARCICASSDGQYALTGSNDTALRLWDLKSNACLQVMNDHAGVIKCVSFCSTGKRGLSASQDGTIKLWEMKSGICLCTFKGHRDSVESVCVTPDDRWVLSGSMDNTLKLWELETGKCLRTFKGHHDSVESVCINQRGCQALSGSWDNTLKLWDLETGQCLRTYEGHLDRITGVCISPNGRHAVSGSWDGNLRLWDLNSRTQGNIEKHDDSISSMCVSSDGRHVLSGSWDKTLRLWDVETGACLRVLKGHADKVTCVHMSPDCQSAFSGGAEGEIQQWDLDTGKMQDRFQHNSRPEKIESICISPDKRCMLLGRSSTMEVWDLESGMCIYAPLIYPGYSFRSVCFCPDGRFALSGEEGNKISLWDISVCRCVRVMKSDDQNPFLDIWSVGVSPDGQRAVSGGEDKTLRLWEIMTGVCMLTITGHESPVWSVCMSPDGQYAISGSKDKTVRIWDLDSGSCFGIYRTGAAVRCVAITPSGDKIICGADDGQIHFLTPINFPPYSPAILSLNELDKAHCPYCNKEFSPVSINVAAIHLHHNQQKCSSVPGEVLSQAHHNNITDCTCPHCGKPLRLNSHLFRGDNDYENMLQASLKEARQRGGWAALGPLCALVVHLTGKGRKDEAEHFAKEIEPLAICRAEYEFSAAVKKKPQDVILLGEYAFYCQNSVHDYSRARGIYLRALQADPTDAINHTNYAGLCLVMENHDEAEQHLREAWRLIAGKADRYTCRTLFLRAALAAVRNEAATPYLGQLKTLFNQDIMPQSSRNTSVKEYLQKHLSSEVFSFLDLIYAAINESDGLIKLTSHPDWQAIKPVSLATPWP